MTLHIGFTNPCNFLENRKNQVGRKKVERHRQMFRECKTTMVVDIYLTRRSHFDASIGDDHQFWHISSLN